MTVFRLLKNQWLSGDLVYTYYHLLNPNIIGVITDYTKEKNMSNNRNGYETMLGDGEEYIGDKGVVLEVMVTKNTLEMGVVSKVLIMSTITAKPTLPPPATSMACQQVWPM
ncbi:hypothetical protein FACS1894152_8520 [Bacilli bacterium]|nr:hypothetical protein FACS1894152_8520 [Bacilli bacterium]